MNILEERVDKKSEKYLQNKVINDKKLQRYIVDNIGLSYDEKIEFSKCKPYINRIIPDVKIVKQKEILALVECKGAKINVTDYVRGIGQLYQYEKFAKENILEKNSKEHYSKNFYTLYIYPSEVTKNNDFNIANFKYPDSTKILQVNLENFITREFNETQKDKFSNTGENLIAISEYYFRDNRIFELYIVIKYLKKNFSNRKESLNRQDLESNHLKKFNTPNNNNWRNAFISLSGLGFISKKNLLTEAGKDISNYNYPQFCSLIYYSYIKPYVDELLPIILDKPNISLNEVSEIIKTRNGDKDVLFLTESGNRYLSSWLGIFRDDFGFINYEPRNKNRTINYDPKDMKESELIDNIKKYTKGTRYLATDIT